MGSYTRPACGDGSWRAALTVGASRPQEDPGQDQRTRSEKKMLFAVSLLSSIAQSRLAQWVRAATMQRRTRF
jgi:hypothetical protein